MLYGFCGGAFGRDSHENKRVESIGADWIVCRDTRGHPVFASGPNIEEELLEYTTPPLEERD